MKIYSKEVLTFTLNRLIYRLQKVDVVPNPLIDTEMLRQYDDYEISPIQGGMPRLTALGYRLAQRKYFVPRQSSTPTGGHRGEQACRPSTSAPIPRIL
ncbi:MAG: hypothetical protein JO283_18080 [Bradyrhizobium sp.]|nr:hypothetical protein [Bradyrhizobium sp.]